MFHCNDFDIFFFNDMITFFDILVFCTGKGKILKLLRNEICSFPHCQAFQKCGFRIKTKILFKKVNFAKKMMKPIHLFFSFFFIKIWFVCWIIWFRCIYLRWLCWDCAVLVLKMNKALNCFWQTNVYKTAGYHNGRDHICAYIYICVCFLIVGDVLLTWYNSSNILYTHNTYINYVSILRCYPLRSLDMIQTNNELYANTSSTSHTALQPIYAIEFSFLLSYDHRILKSSNYLDSTYDCDHLNWFLGLFNHREKE